MSAQMWLIECRQGAKAIQCIKESSIFFPQMDTVNKNKANIDLSLISYTKIYCKGIIYVNVKHKATKI